jgi:predicted Zn-dependent protease
MRRFWVGFGVFGFVMGTAFGQVDVAPVPAGAATGGQAISLVEARGLAAKGKLDAALAELEVLAKATPEEAGVERLRGMIFYQKERLAEGETAFGRAVAQDGEDRESRVMLGVTLYRLGRPGEAIPLLEVGETAVPQETDPTSQGRDVGHPQSGSGSGSGLSANVEPRYVLGLCYTDVKRYDDARRAFAAQFGFGGDSAEAYLVAARLFLRREFAEEAGVFARKALELNPGLPLAHQLLGEVLLAKADLPGAVAELEAERKVNPLNGALYDRLGDAYLRNGQYAEARVALNRAVLLEPNATGPYILLGETLVKMGEPIEAVHYLQRAVTMDAGNSVTHHALGEAYRAMGQMEDANRELRLAVSLQHKGER